MDPPTKFAARAVEGSKIYGSGETVVRALDALSVDLASGELTAIMGPSGSGNSTLMHCLAGLDNLTSGKVFIGETDISELSERALTLLRRDRIGFVFQAFNLVPTLSAQENIVLPQQLGATAPDVSWFERVIEAVALGDRLKHRPNELSGGQQQQLAIARALVGNPKVLLLDEPTEGIQQNIIQQIGHVLKDLATESNMTIVLVEQYLDFVRKFGDKFYLMNRGRVVADGTTEELTDELVSQHLSV